MKKLMALAAVVGAAMLVPVALGATSQGILRGHSGEVKVSLLGIEMIQVRSDIKDGETVQIGENNDDTGDCNGDTGVVRVKYIGTGADGKNHATLRVICAHWTGAEMQFDFFDPQSGKWVVVRALDYGNGAHDATRYQAYDSAAEAQLVVNTGTNGRNAEFTQSDQKSEWKLAAS